MRQVIRVSPRKLHQIYNGVDSVKFRPREGARPNVFPPGFADGRTVVFGSVGRMAEVKDYPILVRAFIQLVRSQPEQARCAKLVIVGEGSARERCLELLQAAGLAHLAWLPGERHDIAEVMRALDVFVLPSQNEGVSNTILEAMASGLPVIATAVGGNVELVEEGINGRLVEAGDVDGLEQALLGYLKAPARIAEHGKQARRHAEERFSIPAMAEAYASVYDQTLGRCC